MTRIIGEGKVRKFFEDSLFYDQSYFNEIFEEYKEALGYLYEQFQEGSKTIHIAPFAIPNELGDYLDGNGFMFEYEHGRLYITKLLDSIQIAIDTSDLETLSSSAVSAGSTVVITPMDSIDLSTVSSGIYSGYTVSPYITAGTLSTSNDFITTASTSTTQNGVINGTF